MINHMKDTEKLKPDNDQTRAKRRRRIVSVIGLLIFVGLSAAIAFPFIKFFKEPELFQEWVAGFGMWGWLVCIGAMVLQIIVAIIPGGAMEIGAGYAFGAVEATILCTIGSIIGCAIVFWLAKAFGVKFVEAFFPIEKIQNLKFLQNDKNTLFILNPNQFYYFFNTGDAKGFDFLFHGIYEYKTFQMAGNLHCCKDSCHCGFSHGRTGFRQGAVYCGTDCTCCDCRNQYSWYGRI